MPLSSFVLYKNYFTELTVSAGSYNFNENSLLATKEGRLKVEITLKVFFVNYLKMRKSIYFEIVLRLLLTKINI